MIEKRTCSNEERGARCYKKGSVYRLPILICIVFYYKAKNYMT
jgi:hypothetical protein